AAGRHLLDLSWVVLVQGNVLAGAGAALLWLAASTRLYGRSRSGPDTAPLLAVQVGLLLLGNAALVVGPAVSLVAQPHPVLPSVLQAGQLWSWLALLATLAVAAWYAGRALSGAAVHLLAGLGLVGGVLAACSVSAWDREAPWLGYHTLLASWTLTGLA